MADNVIKVSVTSTKSQRVSVSSSQVATNITANSDTGRFWSQTSKNWAVSENIVDGEDYSSKYYANKSKQSAQNAEGYLQSTRETYNSFVSDANDYRSELTELKDAGAVEINEAVASGKDEINSAKTTILNDIEFVADGEKKEIEDLIDNGKEELKESIGDVKVLTTLKIGQIGIAPLGIDETLNMERYLNGQIIIQDQFKGFTNYLKRRVELYPSVACTEEEWQTEVTMSAFSQCGKFVIDDNAGTIRLPKVVNIQGLTDLSKLGEIVEAGLPNMSLYTPNSNDKYGSQKNVIYNIGNTSGNANNILGTIHPDKVFIKDDNNIVGNSNTVQQEQIQYPYFIQVATGAETEDNIINEIELNNPFSLLDYKYSEYELNNLSWLRSEGQYNSKAIYPAVYDLLLKIYNGTETKVGVSVKLSTETFTDYDFVLNTAEETFRLPLLDGSESLIDYTTGVEIKNVSVPYTFDKNGALHIQSGAANNNATKLYVNDALVFDSFGGANYAAADNEILPVKKGDVITSKSGNFTKIIFYTNKGNGSLYFYVGETVQNANLINAGRIEEKLVDKVDINSKVIDGQWVCEQASLSTSTAVGTYTVDLSDYLPKDGYNYEVLFNIRVERTTTSGYSNIYTTTDLLDSSVANGNAIAIVGVDGRYMANTFVKPVGTKRYCQMIISSTAVTAMAFVALAYRRIGTNV